MQFGINLPAVNKIFLMSLFILNHSFQIFQNCVILDFLVKNLNTNPNNNLVETLFIRLYFVDCLTCDSSKNIKVFFVRITPKYLTHNFLFYFFFLFHFVFLFYFVFVSFFFDSVTSSCSKFLIAYFNSLMFLLYVFHLTTIFHHYLLFNCSIIIII